MLNLIRVKNYAVIDEVELEFEPGLSVMTGETGAGKSILVDALGLVLGDRADARAVRTGAARAEICASFDCPANHPAATWLQDRGFDEDQDCLIRRIISAEGRSRAFINSNPATLQDLKALGELLINIHGQHSHQSLLHRDTQLEILDFHGRLDALRETVGAAFSDWQSLRLELESRSSGVEEREAQLELIRFQLAELENLAPLPGEREELQTERNRLANVDRLAGELNLALSRLYEAESGSAYALAAESARVLADLSDLDPELAASRDLVAEAEIQLREAASDLGRYRDRLEPDPARLELVENRLARTRELARKHRVEDDDLHTVANSLRERISALDSSGETLESLKKQAAQAEKDYVDAAGALTRGRENTAETLSEQVSAQLNELGIKQGRFRVTIAAKSLAQAGATGLDRVEFQVSLNPGMEFGPLARVASGGELSRISLALEVLGTGESEITTLVFDEVDAGIGGSVAEIVGRRLAELAANRQVLCVTHLAQVASQGQHHFRVVKLSDGTTSRTNVRALGDEDRIDELSRMLGGIEITETTRAHAEEMIQRAAE
jgi:DNA repair protein RecN (Recombination protein N)